MVGVSRFLGDGGAVKCHMGRPRDLTGTGASPSVHQRSKNVDARTGPWRPDSGRWRPASITRPILTACRSPTHGLGLDAGPRLVVTEAHVTPTGTVVTPPLRTGLSISPTRRPVIVTDINKVFTHQRTATLTPLSCYSGPAPAI